MVSVKCPSLNYTAVLLVGRRRRLLRQRDGGGDVVCLKWTGERGVVLLNSVFRLLC